MMGHGRDASVSRIASSSPPPVPCSFRQLSTAAVTCDFLLGEIVRVGLIFYLQSMGKKGENRFEQRPEERVLLRK